MPATIRQVQPGSFEAPRHFYSQTLNAQLHPQVQYFLEMSNERKIERYCHLHPEVDPDAAAALLARSNQVLRWAGADLIPVAEKDGVRRMALIETNSCPSGQKSTPFPGEDGDRSYKKLLLSSFLPCLKRRGLPAGKLAVLYDKNPMEVTGYAAALADLTGETVLEVPCFHGETGHLSWDDQGVLTVQTPEGPETIRAAFRYVTQKPWNRLPPATRTLIFNPVEACLAGGRNKLLAAKAYDLFNAQYEGTGLKIRAPETIWDVARVEIPLWVERFGGVAVVKNPYSNAGQGVYTLTNRDELEAFMDHAEGYDRWIVQALIGNSSWTSRSRGRRFFHIGTIPDRRNRIFVSDLRMMVGSGPDGFFPVALYARRARAPLPRFLEPGQDSWEILGTNLSVKGEDGTWSTESHRLLMMDSKDFPKLGLGLDDLLEGYLQSVMAMAAIDDLCQSLTTKKGRFRWRLFSSLNPDPQLIQEARESLSYLARSESEGK